MNFRKRDYLHDRPSSIGNISGVINNNPNVLGTENNSNKQPVEVSEKIRNLMVSTISNFHKNEL